MRSILSIAMTLFVATISAQSLQSFNSPEPPKVFEFTKYDQMPAGEYTGIPNISIPIHDIKVDEAILSLKMQYHAGGTRVNEESSNVGLGWNMNVGILTQTINGKDDLENFSKRLLKYQDSPLISEWQYLCATMAAFSGFHNCLQCNAEQPLIAGNPKPTNSIFIATDYAFYFPNQAYCYNDYNYDTYDMEPDIFRVNFLGHSLKFIKIFTGPSQGSFEILDNKGYKIEQLLVTPSTQSSRFEWKITDPNGDSYFFTKGKSVQSSSVTNGDPNSPSGSGGNSYSTVWLLTKIITNKYKHIVIDYEDYGYTISKSTSQSFMKSSNIQILPQQLAMQVFKGYHGNIINNSGPFLYYPMTQNTTVEPVRYVTKITTPFEVVNFLYSDRLDRQGDKKLDQISVLNIKSDLVKRVDFSYDYFNASAEGNVVLPASQSQGSHNFTNQYNMKRLKLMSVTELGKKPYLMKYNAIQLPAKNSTAVDYWGYYNGQINNTSLAPNPAAQGFPQVGNNGNNKAAYLNFTRACILEQIIYPTGGKIKYEYELNEYEKSNFEARLANADGSTDKIKGFGLRVTNIQLVDNNSVKKSTSYSYDFGKNIVPYKNMINYNSQQGYGAVGPQSSTYTIHQFSADNYIQSSLLGSYNAVGYGSVTKTDISPSGSGRTVLNFMNVKNTPPHLTDFNGFYSYGKMSLPSLEDINSVENGKLLREEIYDKDNNFIKTTEFNYITKKSTIHYGNKISQFRLLVGLITNNYGVSAVKPQFLVGYYAIYGKQSLLSSQKTTEYFPSGAKYNKTIYSYDINNLPTLTETINQSGTTVERESTTYCSTPDLVAKNRLALPQQKSIIKNGQPYLTNYTYRAAGLNLPEKVELIPNGNSSPGTVKRMFYDQYDDLGNLLQFHFENGTNTCIIWGYKMTLPIAKIDNAVYSQVSAYVANIQNLSNTGTDENIINALDNLRTALPNAMVTSYTHIPGIGVSSITDAKGSTVYYKYDGAGRLESIKDEDKKLLLEYEYHFRPQN